MSKSPAAPEAYELKKPARRSGLVLFVLLIDTLEHRCVFIVGSRVIKKGDHQEHNIDAGDDVYCRTAQFSSGCNDHKNQADKQMFTGVIAHDGEGLLREKACGSCGGCTFVVQKKSGSLLARRGVVF